jgi:hypothetical protein
VAHARAALGASGAHDNGQLWPNDGMVLVASDLAMPTS